LQQGIIAAQGSILITLDADLQNDPADIPYLVLKMQGGYDMVCGWRRTRNDPWLKVFFSRSANSILRVLTGFPAHDVSCTLRAYRRSCFAAFRWEGEGRHRFIPLIMYYRGFQVGEILAEHRPRRFGVSKYHHGRLFMVIKDFLRILITKGKA
jgi:dolichol-phosphate mannosyltransferase